MALLLAFVVTCHAWLDGASLEARSTPAPNDKGIQKSCGRIRALTVLIDLANNQTALSAMLAKGTYDQRQVDYIKSQAATAATELTSLNSNATLIGECGILDARRKVVSQCKRMKKLEKLVMLVNQTAWDEHLAKEILNKKQLESLTKNVAKAQGQLKDLMANNTLVDLCKNRTEMMLKDGSIGNAINSNGAIALSSGAAALSVWPFAIGHIVVAASIAFLTML